MLLDKVIGLVAPQNCLHCAKEGSLLCSACTVMLAESFPPTNSLASPRLESLIVCAEYSGIAKQLVQALKFSCCAEAAEHIAGLMARHTLPDTALLIPVRTSQQRSRQRGYDQSVLITKRLAKRTGLPIADVLLRSGLVRQLGSGRQKRLKQLRGVYSVRSPWSIVGQDVILVDDVVTTGATLNSAADALLHAGARSVEALVFAAA